LVEPQAAPEPLPVPALPRSYQADEMMSIAEVAAKLCVTERTIRSYVQRQQIPHRKLGTGRKPPVRFYRGELEAWIDGVALEVIDNGVKPVGMSVERKPVPVLNPRQGQPVKRTPQLKRRLSYT
jgi:excisionase family DNA binding protein